jgi:2-haloacid dehalogenase
MSTLPALVFDVNETLLDLDAMAPHFDRLFGRSGMLREWFAQLILYSQAITLTGEYVPFGSLGGAVLKMIGAIEGIHVPDSEIQSVKEAIAMLPAHAEVPAALARLRAAGFRMFTLTNNPKATCEAQLRRAGIDHLFDGQFSVDEGVHRYKPAREVYHSIEQALGVPPDQLWLIACHTWDVLGASAAGWKTALILRPGNAPLQVGGQPIITGVDLDEVAEKILQSLRCVSS